MKLKPKMKNSRCQVWGITGPIGSGKSTIAEILEETGGVNIEVDSIGHRCLDNSRIKNRLIEAFGIRIGKTDGTIDRRELGKIVFSSPDALEKLNFIMHPPMIEEIERIISRERTCGKPLVAINAALLYNMKLDGFCDRIIYVRAKDDVRLERVVADRGLSVDRVKVRLFAQDAEPKNDERVIFFENDGTKEDLERWVRKNLFPLITAK